MRNLGSGVFRAVFEEAESSEPSAFGLLPTQNNRRRSFAVSTIVNCIALALFLAFALTHLPQVKPAPVEATALTFELPKPHLPRIPRVKRIKVVPASPKLLAKLAPQKIPTPPRAVAELEPQKIPSPPKAAAAIPSVKVGAFTTVRPTAVANIRSTPTVNVGAFGNPMGARVNANAQEARLQAPVLGTFGGVPGATGTAGSGSPRRGVGGGGGGVRVGGFGTSPGGGGGALPQPMQADTQPVTVTHSAQPVYTAEAHSAGVQGEVVLRVRFAADGRVEVLSVVQPLGHGLDESAENAVRQYRFIPAKRNGQPVDQTTTVHVRFQLA
jgi:protein TonB